MEKIDLNWPVDIYERKQLITETNEFYLKFSNPLKIYDSRENTYCQFGIEPKQDTLELLKIKEYNDDPNNYNRLIDKLGQDFTALELTPKSELHDIDAKKEILLLADCLCRYADNHLTPLQCYISVLSLHVKLSPDTPDEDMEDDDEDEDIEDDGERIYLIVLSPEQLQSKQGEPEYISDLKPDYYQPPSQRVMNSSHILYKTKNNKLDFFAYSEDGPHTTSTMVEDHNTTAKRKVIRATAVRNFAFNDSHTFPMNYSHYDFECEKSIFNFNLSVSILDGAMQILKEALAESVPVYDENTFTNEVSNILQQDFLPMQLEIDLYPYAFLDKKYFYIVIFLSNKPIERLERADGSDKTVMSHCINNMIDDIIKNQDQLSRDPDNNVNRTLLPEDYYPYETISMMVIPLHEDCRLIHSHIKEIHSFGDTSYHLPIIDNIRSCNDWQPLTFNNKKLKKPEPDELSSMLKARLRFAIDHYRGVRIDFDRLLHQATEYCLPVDRPLSLSLLRLNHLKKFISQMLHNVAEHYSIEFCNFYFGTSRERGLAISIQQDIPFNKVITQQNLKQELFFISIKSGYVTYISPNDLPTEIIDTTPLPTTGADKPTCGDEGVIVITPPEPDNELKYLSNMRDELHDDMSSGYFKRQQGDMPLLLTKENRKRAADTDLESLPAYKKMRPNLTLAATGGIGLVGTGAGLGGVFGIAEHIRKRKAGTDGTSGNAGGKGQIGATSVGARGLSGDKGNDGDRAEKGDAGQRGQQGQQGQSGTDGRAGQEGDTGQQGSRGNRGQNGQDGQDGAQGNAGEKGIEGKTGAQGNQGPGGEKGQRGSAGTRGLPGTQTSVDNSTSSGGLGIAAVGVAAAAGAAGIATLASSTAANGLATAAAGAALDAGADRMMGSVGSGHHSTSNKLTPEGTAPADHRSLSAPSHGFSDDLSTHTGALAEPSKQSPDTGLSATNQQNQQPHPAASAYEPTIDTADWDTTMTDGTSDWDYQDPFAADQMASAAPAAASVAGATVAGSVLRSMARSLTGSGKQQGVPQAATGDNTDRTDATHNRSTTNTVTDAKTQSSAAQETPLAASLPADLTGELHGTAGALNNGGITGQKQRYCVPRTGTQPRRMGFSMTHRHQMFAKKRNTHRYATPCSAKRFTIPRTLHSADNKES